MLCLVVGMSVAVCSFWIVLVVLSIVFIQILYGWVLFCDGGVWRWWSTRGREKAEYDGESR